MYYTIQPVYNLKINRYIITGKHTAWVKVDTSYYQDRFWVPLIYMYSSSPYTIQKESIISSSIFSGPPCTAGVRDSSTAKRD